MEGDESGKRSNYLPRILLICAPWEWFLKQDSYSGASLYAQSSWERCFRSACFSDVGPVSKCFQCPRVPGLIPGQARGANKTGALLPPRTSDLTERCEADSEADNYEREKPEMEQAARTVSGMKSELIHVCKIS